jgi:hypothetical protein
MGESAMTRLAEFRRRLHRLKQRRRNVRLGAAYSGLALALLGILAAAFLVDWFLDLNRLQRAISLVLCGSLLVWAFRRYTLPWLRRRETDLDMVLLVEKQERIDSDLIAAIQFDSPQASAGGSILLQRAVIDRAAAAAGAINVMRGLDRRGLDRRLQMLILAVVVWAAVAVGSPRHVAAFFNRLFLGSRYYPSRTIIDSIAINGRMVHPQFPSQTPLRVVCGQSVQFEVHCSGQLPGGGEVQITAVRDGLSTAIALAPLADRHGVYVGQLPRLVDDATYRISAGDAWTDSGRVIVGQLPALEIRLEVVPPSYTAKDSGPLWMPTGLRQATVIEGSRVSVHLDSDKPLNQATATIAGHDYLLKRSVNPEANQAGPRFHWVLDPTDDMPLMAVREPVRYAIQINDAEDQQLERPLEGMIRVQADAPPRVAAAVVTRSVLPGAVPTIYVRAVDDYGVASLALAYEVVRADGQTEENELPIYSLREGQPPEKNIEREYVFALGPLKLAKDDTVKVAIRATDFRGRQEGKSTAADPLVLQVTDEQGVLAAMLEADKQSATELKGMIQRQLGIGESP